ncbi:allergen Tha p 1-like [Periplaneta americana]|uniref:allergen Tha p 1-like n=1 Tax=Periplaneta americana TaxID=6978 RepID=UPI0037E748DA
MKALVALTVACLLFAVAATESLEDVDLDVFFQDPQRVKAYGNCLLDESTCNDKLRVYRSWLVQAYEDQCSKCTERQKFLVRKAVTISREKTPEIWTKIPKLYDPDGTRTEKFEEFMKGH